MINHLTASFYSTVDLQCLIILTGFFALVVGAAAVVYKRCYLLPITGAFTFV